MGAQPPARDRATAHVARSFLVLAIVGIAVACASQPGVIEMRVLCAWCCREGQPGYLGEREPLDDPEPTHGVCPHHKAQLLESLPSRSFPEVELLVVVRRDRTLLYEQLTWLFAGTPHVKVIRDRRVTHEDRQERTRRIRTGTLSPLGDFTFVRFTPKTPRPSDYARVDFERITSAMQGLTLHS